MPSILRKLIGLVVFLLLWEAASRSGLVQATYVPPPSVVLVKFAGLFGNPQFLTDVVSTLLSWVIALGLATLIGVPLGLLLGGVRLLRTVSSTIVEFLRPLPSVALIPLVISVLGSGAQTKIALATFAALWPVLFNTIYALHEVDPQLVDTARSFRVSRLRRLTGVTLPSIAPFVLTGVRFSASVALIVLVSTEFLTGGTIGLGQFVYTWGSSAGRMDMVLAGTVFAGLFGYLVNIGFVAAQRRWLVWAPAGGAM
ncbi:ABC transporter permease subunit [Solihabitans fulvus]|uniref:ABC transporter permease subunit n=1 Tax=Solihabitans fulvus TaxID=1892852 RepID=A0A5B2W9Z7_9PSEU|nr:ABC transporter permease subunit [Solihabitans fulvus]KAA2248751.1 ABC transporter permease subunit [Solihabitans fulvus]